jgi:dihydrofolate reductase
MSKLIVSMMTSVDGFIEGPNRELNWTVESPDFNAYCDQMLSHTDTMLFGRVSYEMMVKYWPAAETKPKDEWERTFARKMNTLPKVVLSRTPPDAAWNNTRVVKDNVREEVTALKQRAAKDCFVFGGAGIIATLRRLGLIDEYRVVLHPIVLGRGTPLFVGVEERFSLQLIREQRFDSGVVVLYYRPS